MGLSEKENSSFPKETETRVRPGSQLAPENKTTESAASGHAAVKTTPKKARSKKRAVIKKPGHIRLNRIKREIRARKIKTAPRRKLCGSALRYSKIRRRHHTGSD